MPQLPQSFALLPKKLQIRKLQRWYRRGFNDGKAGRPALDLKGMSDQEAMAYTTGRADGAAVTRNERPG